MAIFGNRYTVLAALIRYVHDEATLYSVSPKDAKRFLLQISRLRDHLRLIGMKQNYAATAFSLAQGAIVAEYFKAILLSRMLFLSSISLLMGSMLLFPSEIQIANMALELNL